MWHQATFHATCCRGHFHKAAQIKINPDFWLGPLQWTLFENGPINSCFISCKMCSAVAYSRLPVEHTVYQLNILTCNTFIHVLLPSRAAYKWTEQEENTNIIHLFNNIIYPWATISQMSTGWFHRQPNGSWDKYSKCVNLILVYETSLCFIVVFLVNTETQAAFSEIKDVDCFGFGFFSFFFSRLLARLTFTTVTRTSTFQVCPVKHWNQKFGNILTAVIHSNTATTSLLMALWSDSSLAWAAPGWWMRPQEWWGLENLNQIKLSLCRISGNRVH